MKVESIKDAIKKRPGFTSFKPYIYMIEDEIERRQTEIHELRSLLKKVEIQQECYEENLDREE